MQFHDAQDRLYLCFTPTTFFYVRAIGAALDWLVVNNDQIESFSKKIKYNFIDLHNLSLKNLFFLFEMQNLSGFLIFFLKNFI